MSRKTITTICEEKKNLELYEALNFVYGSCSIESFFNDKNEIKKKVSYYVKSKNDVSNSWKDKPLYCKNYNGLYILTGIKSNLIVLDLDNMENEVNKVLYQEATKCCNMIVKTRKGFHLYFKYEDEYNVSVHKKKYDFDLLSNDSHVYAPPSHYLDPNNNGIKYILMQKPNNKLNHMSDNLKLLLNEYITDKSRERLESKDEIKKFDNSIKKDKSHIDKIKINKVSDNIMKKILSKLDSVRYDDFYYWLRVGYALKNDGYDVNLWDEFSRKSKKYEPGVCNYYYNKLLYKNESISTSTLWYWLSKDDLDYFKELQSEVIMQNYEIDETLFSDNDFDTHKMLDFIKKDIKHLGQDNYLNFIENTNSFKYFNHYHCFVEYGNIYFRKEYCGSNFTLNKMDDLEQIYKCLKVGKYNFVKYWMENRYMLRYKNIKFLPKCNKDNKILNLFTGFKYENSKKNVVDNNNINFVKDHIKYICNDDDKISDYIIKWLAHVVQKPYRKTETVIVLYSKIEGIGKNSLTDLIIKIFDNYVGEIKSIESVENKFNSDMSCKLIIIGDEIKAKAFNVADQLKNLITQKRMRVEFKGKDPFLVDDYSNYIFTTNNEFVFRISDSDRRYLLVECPLNKKNSDYFNEYYKKLCDNNFISDIFLYLQNLDISNFDPRSIPLTEYKKRNILINLPSYIQMMRNNLCQFQDKKYTIAELYPLAIEYAKVNKLNYNFSSKTMAIDYNKFFGKFTTKPKGITRYNFTNIDDIDNILSSQIGNKD